MTDHSAPSVQQIIGVLSHSLEKALDEVYPRRYGASLSLRRIDDPPDNQTVAFKLNGPDASSLHISVRISHVGGNVYDISAQVENGDVRRFTYSEPADSGSSLSIAPYLGKKIAKYVLDEAEKSLGKKILRRQGTEEAA